MSISDGLDPYIFLSKNGKDAVYEMKIGRKSAFCRQSRPFSSVNNIIKAPFTVCTLNWSVKNYFSRQKKSIKTRNKNFVNFSINGSLSGIVHKIFHH